MSRIGRSPITIPSGVTVTVENEKISVSGPLGKLERTLDRCIKVNVENNVVTVTRINDENDVKAKHGLYRTLINNMVEGVVKGFSKTLQFKGVGYKASKQGSKLVLNLGFSHPVEFIEENGIKIDVAGSDIKISGIDKQEVGQFAAKIRDVRPVEPYHGYGIKYSDEVVIKKQGKTGKAGKK